MDEIVKTKICAECKTEKTLDEFSNTIKGSKNKKIECRDCESLLRQTVKQDYRNKVLKKHKENVKNLDNSYIISLLKQKGFSKNLITKELIQVQQLIIKTKRL